MVRGWHASLTRDVEPSREARGLLEYLVGGVTPAQPKETP